MAGISFKLTRNDISPKLSQMADKARNPEKVFRAMGTTFMSLTMGNFNDAGAEYRPKPWPAKKDGTPSKLQKSGTLSRSFHLEVTNSYAKVSNPVIYAARHQFGYPPGNTPPRPFFPVDEDGKLTPKAEEKVQAAGQRAMARELGAD